MRSGALNDGEYLQLSCVQHPHEVGFGLFSGLRQPLDSANIRSSGARISLSQTRVPDSGKGGSKATRTRSLTRPVALRTDSPRQPTPADTGRRTSQSGSFLMISVGYAKPKIPQFGLKKVLNVRIMAAIIRCLYPVPGSADSRFPMKPAEQAESPGTAGLSMLPPSQQFGLPD